MDIRQARAAVCPGVSAAGHTMDTTAAGVTLYVDAQRSVHKRRPGIVLSTHLPSIRFAESMKELPEQKGCSTRYRDLGTHLKFKQLSCLECTAATMMTTFRFGSCMNQACYHVKYLKVSCVIGFAASAAAGTRAPRFLITAAHSDFPLAPQSEHLKSSSLKLPLRRRKRLQITHVRFRRKQECFSCEVQHLNISPIVKLSGGRKNECSDYSLKG